MDKKIKRRVNEARSSLKASDILLHPSFSSFLNTENRRIFKQWMIPQKKVHLYKNRSPEIAYTDNRDIYINVNAPILNVEREEAVSRVYGLTFHEIGHILFTSYAGLMNYISNIEAGIMWPAIPETEWEDNLKEMLEYISFPNKAKNLAVILKMLSNCIEDARIEYMLENYCEGCEKYKKGLNAVKNWLLDNSMPSLTEMRGNPNLCDAQIMNQLIFNYARFVSISGYKSEYEEDELYQLLNQCKNYIDDAIYSRQSSEFYNNLNMIMIICWPVYKKYLDDIQDNDTGKSSDDGEPSETSGDKSSKETNDENPSTADSEGENESSESDNKDSSEKTDDEDLSEMIKKALEKALEGMSPAHEDEERKAKSKGSDNKDIFDKIEKKEGEEERAEYQKTDSIKTGEKGFTKKSFTDNEGVKIDIDALINRIAKEKVNDEIAEEKLKMLNETLGDMEYSDINKNVSVQLLSPKVTDSMKSEYNNNYEINYLVKLGKEIAKKISKSLPQEKEPIVLKNRVVGSTFNASSVARNDLRYFSKKTKPEEGPTLSLGLVVDESGSMLGKRAQYAKAAAVALYSCAKELDIQTCIYGHTADRNGYDVNIINYTDFEHPQSDDKYKLMNIQARSNNRDAVPVQFVAERLLKTDCEKKLLIIISDGQPMASGYYGTAADKDLQHTIKKYSKKGVTIIAAAIGDDKKNIKRIYGEKSFLDISDISALPKEMLKIIRRNMK